MTAASACRRILGTVVLVNLVLWAGDAACTVAAHYPAPFGPFALLSVTVCLGLAVASIYRDRIA